MSSFDVQSLPPETRAWLEAKVKAGEFADVDAFVSDVLIRLQRFEAEEVEEIRQMVAEGIAVKAFPASKPSRNCWRSIMRSSGKGARPECRTG